MCVLSTYKGYSRCSKWCPPMVTHAQHLLITKWHVHLSISRLREDSRTSFRCKSATGEECADGVRESPKKKIAVSCRRTSLAIPQHHVAQSTCQKPHQDTCGWWAHNAMVRCCAFQLLKHDHYDIEHCGTQPYVSDKRILKTISTEHLPHFIASPILDSIAEHMPQPGTWIGNIYRQNVICISK